MENNNLQFDINKFSQWTAAGGLFGSYGEDHAGAIAFTHYLNKIKRENGDKLPYEDWHVINPEGFLEFLENEKVNRKNYDHLIEKTRRMIAQGEMNYDNVLYFAKAFNDLGLLYKRDEEATSLYDNSVFRQLQTPQQYSKNTPQAKPAETASKQENEKITSPAEEPSVKETSVITNSEEKESASATAETEEETNFNEENEFTALSPLVSTPPAQRQQKEKEESRNQNPEKKSELAYTGLNDRKQVSIPANSSQEERKISQESDPVEKKDQSVVSSYETPQKKSVTKFTSILPENRRILSSFENLRVRKPTKTVRKIADQPKAEAKSQPQIQQGYSQNSQYSQNRDSYQRKEVPSGGAKIAKRVGLLTGGGVLAFIGLIPPADAATLITKFF